MAWWAPIAAAGIGAAGSILGGSKTPDEITQSQEPWSGVQPYLTTQGPMLPWTGPQALNIDWMRYLQDVGEGQEGSWLRTPPPMMINDPRFTGENVYQPENPGGILGVQEWGQSSQPGVSVVSGIIPPVETIPSPAVQEPIVDNNAMIFAGPDQVPPRDWRRMKQAGPSGILDLFIGRS